MPSSSYGTYSPNAIDPFSIESTLANIVGQNNPAAASQALDLYQIKNQTAQSEYNQQAAQQHEFAKQGLAQQLYEKQLAAAGGATAHDGGLALLMQTNPEIFQHADPAALQEIVGRGTRLQDAKIAETGLGAAVHGVQSGNIIPNSAVQGLTNLPTVQGVPQAEKLQGMRDAAHAATAKRDDLVAPIRSGVDPNTGQPLYANLKIPMNATPEQAQERIRRGRALLTEFETPGTGIPGGPEPGKGTGPAKLGGATNLPLVQKDTPAGKVEDPRTAQGSKQQGLARQHINNLSPQAKADVEAGTVNGLISLQKINGKTVFVGKSGNTYAAVP